mmetsp:Transcript_104889/g.335919  ORF Transcript_104889/g.335919 Transcript_104889/m.335919 type:complete len:670 (-) Transcript_104889:125-2134(-)
MPDTAGGGCLQASDLDGCAGGVGTDEHHHPINNAEAAQPSIKQSEVPLGEPRPARRRPPILRELAVDRGEQLGRVCLHDREVLCHSADGSCKGRRRCLAKNTTAIEDFVVGEHDGVASSATVAGGADVLDEPLDACTYDLDCRATTGEDFEDTKAIRGEHTATCACQALRIVKLAWPPNVQVLCTRDGTCRRFLKREPRLGGIVHHGPSKHAQPHDHTHEKGLLQGLVGTVMLSGSPPADVEQVSVCDEIAGPVLTIAASARRSWVVVMFGSIHNVHAEVGQLLSTDWLPTCIHLAKSLEISRICGFRVRKLLRSLVCVGTFWHGRTATRNQQCDAPEEKLKQKTQWDGDRSKLRIVQGCCEDATDMAAEQQHGQDGSESPNRSSVILEDHDHDVDKRNADHGAEKFFKEVPRVGQDFADDEERRRLCEADCPKAHAQLAVIFVRLPHVDHFPEGREVVGVLRIVEHLQTRRHLELPAVGRQSGRCALRRLRRRRPRRAPGARGLGAAIQAVAILPSWSSEQASQAKLLHVLSLLHVVVRFLWRSHWPQLSGEQIDGVLVSGALSLHTEHDREHQEDHRSGTAGVECEDHKCRATLTKAGDCEGQYAGAQDHGRHHQIVPSVVHPDTHHLLQVFSCNANPTHMVRPFEVLLVLTPSDVQRKAVAVVSYP